MRFREIEEVLEQSIPNLKFDATTLAGTGMVKVTKFREAIAATRQIARTGTLQQEVKAVLAFEALSKSVNAEVTINNELFQSFQGAISNLRTRAAALLQALTDVLPEEDETTVSIKLPPDLDLKGLAKVAADLDKIFQQSMVNEYIKADIKITGFDQGSEWIVLYLGSAAAISLLAGMVRLIYDVKNKEIEVQAKKAMLKGVQIQAASLEDLHNALHKEVEILQELRLRELLESAGIPEKEKELAERIKLSIKLLSGLFARGLEIYPALSASVATKNLFPDPKKLLEAMKQLPERSSADDKTGENG